MLQRDARNCVAFDPALTQPQRDTFTLQLTHPHQPQSLSLRFEVKALATAAASFGELHAIWYDASQTPQGLHIQQRWPLRALRLDSERAGIGLGESALTDNASQGLVRRPEVSLCWDLQFADVEPAPAAHDAPHDPHRWLTPHHHTAHPCGRVVRGQLEIWHGSGRHVPLTRLQLAGWHCHQAHRWAQGGTSAGLPWGRAPAAVLACQNFENAPPGTFFEASCGVFSLQRWGLGRWLQRPALLGRLRLGQQLYQFANWRQLWRSPGLSCTPQAANVLLESSTATLRAELQAPPASTVVWRATADERVLFANNLSHLKLTLQPRGGAPTSFSSRCASYEFSHRLEADQLIAFDAARPASAA